MFKFPFDVDLPIFITKNWQVDSYVTVNHAYRSLWTPTVNVKVVGHLPDLGVFELRKGLKGQLHVHTRGTQAEAIYKYGYLC